MKTSYFFSVVTRTVLKILSTNLTKYSLSRVISPKNLAIVHQQISICSHNCKQWQLFFFVVFEPSFKLSVTVSDILSKAA